MLDETARANRVQDVTKKFNLEVGVERALVEQMGEKSDFLKKINLVPMTELSGEKVGLGAGAPIASRTDTNNEDRETSELGFSDDKYALAQTNFDTHLSYKRIDTLAKFPDFAVRYRNVAMNRMAQDRIMIGWNGTHAATKTDRAINPLLQDVNIGWLEKLRTKAPKRFMGYDLAGEVTDDAYKVGEGGDYATLDQLVFDVMSQLLEPWFVGSDDLVLMIGRELWAGFGLKLYSENKPTELSAAHSLIASQLIAGLPVVSVPFMPARAVVITSYDNLSLYYQLGGTRRATIDNPKRDRIEEYMSSNDAYVIEDFGKIGAVRSGAILLKKSDGTWY
jgi:P2 family phage major capsid protein